MSEIALHGLTNITNKILADAEAQAAALLRDAEESAERTAATRDAQLQARRAEQAQQTERRAADIEEKAVLRAQLEGRKRVTAQKQALLQDAYAKALRDLAALPASDTRALLMRLACEADADKQGGELLFSPADQKAHGAAVCKEVNQRMGGTAVTLSAETASIAGGVILRRPNMEINASIEVALQSVAESCAREMAAALFD